MGSGAGHRSHRGVAGAPRRAALGLLLAGGLMAVASARPLRQAAGASAAGPASAASSASTLRGLLSADEIVARNVAARGGLEAWRQVQTMSFAGHLHSARAAGGAAPMPFKMELARPNKTRFEVLNMDQRFTRIFDGSHGWKLRPGRAGLEMQPFTADEERYQQDEFPIDGLLIDHKAKGVSVALEGINELEGRKAYRLGLRLPSGASRRLWVDAETFLETRFDRPSWHPMHRGASVSVLYRDYRTVDGLTLPMTLETGPAPEAAPRAASAPAAAKAPPRDRLAIERVVLNATLSEQAFAKPNAPRSRNAAVPLGTDPRR